MEQHTVLHPLVNGKVVASFNAGTPVFSIWYAVKIYPIISYD